MGFTWFYYGFFYGFYMVCYGFANIYQGVLLWVLPPPSPIKPFQWVTTEGNARVWPQCPGRSWLSLRTWHLGVFSKRYKVIPWIYCNPSKKDWKANKHLVVDISCWCLVPVCKFPNKRIDKYDKCHLEITWRGQNWCFPMGVWCSRNYHPVLPNIGVENPWKATFLDHLPSGFHHAFSTSRGTDRLGGLHWLMKASKPEPSRIFQEEWRNYRDHTRFMRIYENKMLK